MPLMTAKPDKDPQGVSHDAAPTDDIPDPPVPQALQDALDTARPIDAPDTPAASQAVETPEEPNYLNLATLEHKVLTLADTALFRLSEHGAIILKHIDEGFAQAMDRLQVNKAALEALAQATREQQRITPYSGTVSAVTPSGFPLSLQVQGRSREEFLEALAGLLSFLKEQGFTPLMLPQLV